ncbi:LPD11 domain-containing protein [Bacillus sp. FSL K6-2839]|uniref:LPD11 domain-containing protein n=1 Tax=Bacillus sp. FSL K6-2839 TaxID=2921480 RepID=UPI0030F55DAF
MNIFKSSATFRYQLLSRLKSDCEYYLGYGNRNKRSLWAEDEKSQIKTMKELWESFSTDEKPEWLTWDNILEYENRMISHS